ncbi:hypothetical protein H0X48_00115 [Candidatus Dependentiae bacterium]|nr:hypothetical protein [Candidatus Dependentiae bacterium]
MLKLKILLLILCTTLQTNALLFEPCKITPLEYSQLQKFKLEQITAFKWRDPLFEFKICYHDHTTSFTLFIDTALHKQLPENIKNKFICTSNEKTHFAYEYTWGTIKQDSTSAPIPQEYYKAKPYQSECAPHSISGDNLSQIIKQKRVVFYTGAGISACSVPSMQKLEDMLGFARNGRRPDGLKTVSTMLSNPEMVTRNFGIFVLSTIESATTLAHKRLAVLAQHLKTSIITENIDLLHEATGIRPLFAGDQKTHDLWSAQNLQEVDLVICIGLSHDDRGFIAHYKNSNAQAQIVALDYKAPNYLDDHDMLLPGDIQVNLNLLANQIMENSSLHI